MQRQRRQDSEHLESGNDITLKDMATSMGTAGAAGSGGTFGTNDLVVTGQIMLDSSQSFSATDSGAIFLKTSTQASQLQKAQDMDVSNVDAANRTLAIVDSAISAIASQRAAYGALQSRFETTVANLQVSSENMSMSRSRIQDADFASEGAVTRLTLVRN